MPSRGSGAWAEALWRKSVNFGKQFCRLTASSAPLATSLQIRFGYHVHFSVLSQPHCTLRVLGVPSPQLIPAFTLVLVFIVVSPSRFRNPPYLRAW
jgi:hypothetical protein